MRVMPRSETANPNTVADPASRCGHATQAYHVETDNVPLIFTVQLRCNHICAHSKDSYHVSLHQVPYRGEGANARNHWTIRHPRSCGCCCLRVECKLCRGRRSLMYRQLQRAATSLISGRSSPMHGESPHTNAIANCDEGFTHVSKLLLSLRGSS